MFRGRKVGYVHVRLYQLTLNTDFAFCFLNSISFHFLSRYFFNGSLNLK